MEIIHAWIYDPSKPSLFKSAANERSALFTLRCDRTEECDVFKQCNSCIYTSAMKRCKYGQKNRRDGYTKRARSFYTQISDWRKEFAEYFKRLNPLEAYNRVFKIGDYWHLPYSHMVKGIWGRGSPLESEWVPLSDMNSDLMERILTARPNAEFGGEIKDYQEKHVPKFLSDIKANYPELWALVPPDQKARLEDVDYRGRKAVLATCLPGRFDGWEWDGKRLKGRKDYILPVKGAVEIVPDDGVSIKVTDNSTVGPKTRFVD